MGPPLHVERHVLTTATHGVPLQAPMNKYTRAGTHPPVDPHQPCVILLLGHGAGFFKEMWEPIIEDMFSAEDRLAPELRPRIREVWALDCQNHGEACTLNEQELARRQDLLTIWDYADAFASLYNSGLLGEVDPKIHRVVLCGHSAGAVGVTFATSFFNPPYRLPFSALILIDPPIWTRAMADRHNDVYKLVEATTPIRRDIWDNAQHARRWLKSRPPWGGWDKRVFDIYVKHGLRALPTAFYPDRPANGGVTLTTHRLAENIAFAGKHFGYDAINRLNQICEHLPVHLIFGDRNDMFDRELQESIVDPREGRVMASVTRIKDAGHLVAQEAPAEVAQSILAVLCPTPHLLSKL